MAKIFDKRLVQGLIGGSLLGLICVVGASVRSGFTASPVFVLALWYNRFLMGLIIGAPWPPLPRSSRLLRGALIGLLVSLAFYLATDFRDPVSFAAGILYGLILDNWLSPSAQPDPPQQSE